MQEKVFLAKCMTHSKPKYFQVSKKRLVKGERSKVFLIKITSEIEFILQDSTYFPKILIIHDIITLCI